MNTILRSRTYPGGKKFKLVQGDITRAAVAVIVNPANSQLQHGGGLAGILLQRAGPSLQTESDAWIMEHGPVQHNSPAYTGAGELPYNYIIHAVGPIWGSGNEPAKLRAAVSGSLRLAADLGQESLALPAISCGVFGYPQDLAAGEILSEVDHFLTQRLEDSPQEIQLVLFGEQAGAVFSAAWDDLGL